MLDLDAAELDIIWKALGEYHDTISPDRHAFRWKIIQLMATVHEELVRAE